MHAQAITPPGVMDGKKTSSLQILTLFLCFLVVAADGFDVASVGYVAPLLKKAWALSPAQLGPIFGAGLFGLTVGSFLFGPLADRIGRKRVITISLVLFGIGSFACAYAPSPLWLVALRFATGAGLGGAMPNAITLSSEFSPARSRALMVTLMFCGFTLGLAFGGAVTSLVSRFYSGVTRYTTSSFLRMKLGDALQGRSVATYISESPEEARAHGSGASQNLRRARRPDRFSRPRLGPRARGSRKRIDDRRTRPLQVQRIAQPSVCSHSSSTTERTLSTISAPESKDAGCRRRQRSPS
ncbi:aromatic acid/H+ symport family MFS transporter [Paraburkholderia sp. RP-4-7]|uniref:Aromatic acid/H+ symport family MFS transporter n=1 Tax=Paraburkholderia polaris TaxID=2728848 RepID=A0A848IQR9_9BURK|nr:MFS transporter [Paraburkholderia polaris]NMM04081.1 aromatic acid/H+ symport family MFS transporter [Paraburkholderia polaris]